jgi:DNA polymerase III epsilon subunit-like protein
MNAGIGYTEARHASLTVIDFETTGSVAGYPVEPWQVGIVRMREGRVCVGEHAESLLRIGDRPFNPHAPGRHAQIRGQLAAAPSPGEQWPGLSAWLIGVPLAAHNTGTERGILSRMAPLHRLGPWIDTLALTRHTYPRLASHALEDVTAALGLDTRIRTLCPGRAAHDALYDAFACAVLLEHFLSLPGWEHVTVEALADT